MSDAYDCGCVKPVRGKLPEVTWEQAEHMIEHWQELYGEEVDKFTKLSEGLLKEVNDGR